VTFKYQMNFQKLMHCWLCTQAGFLGLKIKGSPNVFHSVTGYLSEPLLLCGRSYWKAYATCGWVFSPVVLCQTLPNLLPSVSTSSFSWYQNIPSLLETTFCQLRC
jgi:hypothetical protein